jgi:hypothetical protein
MAKIISTREDSSKMSVGEYIMSGKISGKLGWLMIKIIKLPIYLLIIAIYLVIAGILLLNIREYLNHGETWVYFETSAQWQGKILVPEEIAKYEDCEKFNKWQYDHLPLVMHSKECPWYVYTPFYKVQIGDVKLNIPRKYLLLKGETDEYSNIITSTSWIYPSMELAGHRLSYDSFWFSIENYPLDDRHTSIFQKYFWSFLHIDPKKDKYEIIFLGMDEKSQMNKYRFDDRSTTLDPPRVFESFVYTNDDIHNPEEFIVCGAERPDVGCESVFKYKDVYINYMFRYCQLNNYRDIKSKIIKFIQEWEIKE